MISEENSGITPYQSAAEIVAVLQAAEFKAFFVGGSVRDKLLGIVPKDIDIASNAKPEQVAAIFPDCKMVGACFGVSLVKHKSVSFEVAALRQERNYLDGRRPEEVTYTDDPETDACRRDFTINAMFYDPVADKVLDFFGGREDLKLGLVRTVGNPDERFSEDYLRMLRAVRFASRLNFDIEPETASAIKRHAAKTAKLAPERVKEELDRMLLGPAPSRAVKLLFELDILAAVLPEVAAMHGVEQPEEFHPEGDVLTHTLLMLDHMKLPTPALAWSILLHDVAKPATRFIDDDGRARFFGHEEQGAKMAEKIMLRLRHSGDLTDTVSHAVRNHMRFAHVDKMRTAKWRRLIGEENFATELELHRIDCMGSHGKIDNYLLLLDRLSEIGSEPELPRPFITGRDLIAAGLKPGPGFGKILNEITDLQLAGDLKTRDDALAYLQQNLSRYATQNA
mgnify:CR=1 FL=1